MWKHRHSLSPCPRGLLPCLRLPFFVRALSLALRPTCPTHRAIPPEICGLSASAKARFPNRLMPGVQVSGRGPPFHPCTPGFGAQADACPWAGLLSRHLEHSSCRARSQCPSRKPELRLLAHSQHLGVGGRRRARWAQGVNPHTSGVASCPPSGPPHTQADSGGGRVRGRDGSVCLHGVSP